MTRWIEGNSLGLDPSQPDFQHWLDQSGDCIKRFVFDVSIKRAWKRADLLGARIASARWAERDIRELHSLELALPRLYEGVMKTGKLRFEDPLVDPYYPQSNGKMERWHRTLKADAIRRFEPSNPKQARKIIGDFVNRYNCTRLHSAIGYVTPADMLAGRETEIWKARDQKLEHARDLRCEPLAPTQPLPS